MLFAVTRVGVQAWTAGADQATSSWIEIVSVLAAGLLGLLMLFAIGRALRHRGRYRAVASLTEGDREVVRKAVEAAERRTVGEILPVVVERSDPHPGAPWIAALVTLLTGSVLLAAYLPWGQPGWLLTCQLALGASGWILARALPDLMRRFISEERASRVSSEQAFQEFYRHDLHKTEAATGVLLFVSLLEHRVIVMADTGINAKVEPADWERTDRAILDGIRAGSLRDGLVNGIESAAELLEQHFPWTEGDRNDIPNRVIVRRE